MPSDLVLYAIVAAGLVFWLRNILGTGHGEEHERHNPYGTQADSPQPGSPEMGKVLEVNQLSPEASLKEGLDRGMAINGADAEVGLVNIAKFDRGFDLAFFLSAAQDAFILVVEAFASGDKDTLKGLLSDNVFAAFNTALEQREKDGHSASVEIHAIRKTEVIEAALEGQIAYITVRFVADETNILRDKDDKVISGNPDYISETIDVWKFGRDLKSKDPTWRVFETREEEEAPEEEEKAGA